MEKNKMGSGQSRYSQWEQPKGIASNEDISLPWKICHISPVVRILTMAFDDLPLIQGICSSSVNKATAC